MDGKTEQRVRDKFSKQLSKSVTETLREDSGEHSLRWTAVFEWYSCFKDGSVSVEDDERPAQPSTSKMTENDQNNRGLIPMF
jgi:hypothetical protein